MALTRRQFLTLMGGLRGRGGSGPGVRRARGGAPGTVAPEDARGPRDGRRQLVRDAVPVLSHQRGRRGPRHGGPGQEDRGQRRLPHQPGTAQCKVRGRPPGVVPPRPHPGPARKDRWTRLRAVRGDKLDGRHRPSRLPAGAAARGRERVQGGARHRSGARPPGTGRRPLRLPVRWTAHDVRGAGADQPAAARSSTFSNRTRCPTSTSRTPATSSPLAPTSSTPGSRPSDTREGTGSSARAIVTGGPSFTSTPGSR